jgi:hypothetical protein
MKYVVGAAAIAALCIGLGAAPIQAQTAGYMWCSATATNGNSTARYYSKVFKAGDSEAQAKAAEFKSAAEEAELSAAYIVATCRWAPDQQSAATALNNARVNSKGQSLDWPE